MSEEAKKAAREWQMQPAGPDDDEDLANLLDHFAAARVEEARREWQKEIDDGEMAREILRRGEAIGRIEERKGIVAFCNAQRDAWTEQVRKAPSWNKDACRSAANTCQALASAIERREDLPKAEEKCGRCGGSGLIDAMGGLEGEELITYDCIDCSGTGKAGK